MMLEFHSQCDSCGNNGILKHENDVISSVSTNQSVESATNFIGRQTFALLHCIHVLFRCQPESATSRSSIGISYLLLHSKRLYIDYTCRFTRTTAHKENQQLSKRSAYNLRSRISIGKYLFQRILFHGCFCKNTVYFLIL
jgi:hypothetical protein